MKSFFCKVLVRLYMDRMFRYLNRKRLLVVMYHGICRKDYNPPVWTQLPEKRFREQLQYLKSRYNIISLKELLACLKNGMDFPERSALITFDDGLRNNYTVAFPILKKYSIPATIFLTADFINTDKILWFDELYFLIQKAIEDGHSLKDIGFMDNGSFDDKNMWNIYFHAVEGMKKMSEQDRDYSMDLIRTRVDINTEALLEDFGILTQEQIMEMDKSGLVEFGVHTATHQILSNIGQDQWEKELSKPRQRLSNIIGKDMISFCYPNGNPKTDFNESHVIYLKECGYKCAFTAESALYLQGGNPYRIGRIPAGNDFTSDRNFFKLNTSGSIDYMKKMKKKMKFLGE